MVTFELRLQGWSDSCAYDVCPVDDRLFVLKPLGIYWDDSTSHGCAKNMSDTSLVFGVDGVFDDQLTCK